MIIEEMKAFNHNHFQQFVKRKNLETRVPSQNLQPRRRQPQVAASERTSTRPASLTSFDS